MVSLACPAGLVARGAVYTLLYYKQYYAACQESRAFLRAAAYTDLWVKKLPALAPRDWVDAGAGRFCAPFLPAVQGRERGAGLIYRCRAKGGSEMEHGFGCNGCEVGDIDDLIFAEEEYCISAR